MPVAILCQCCAEGGCCTREGGGCCELCSKVWFPENKPSPILPAWFGVMHFFAAISLYFAYPEETADIKCPRGLTFYRGIIGLIVLNALFMLQSYIRQRRLFDLAFNAESIAYAQRCRFFKLDACNNYFFTWLMIAQMLWLALRDFIIGSKERLFGTCTGASPYSSVSILVFLWVYVIGCLGFFLICLIFQVTIETKLSRLGGRDEGRLGPLMLPMGMQGEETPFDEVELSNMTQRAPGRSPAPQARN